MLARIVDGDAGPLDGTKDFEGLVQQLVGNERCEISHLQNDIRCESYTIRIDPSRARLAFSALG